MHHCNLVYVCDSPVVRKLPLKLRSRNQQNLQPWRYPSLCWSSIHASINFSKTEHSFSFSFLGIQIWFKKLKNIERLKQCWKRRLKGIIKLWNRSGTCSFHCPLLFLLFLNVIRLNKQLCMSNQVWEKKFEILRQRYSLQFFNSNFCFIRLHELCYIDYFSLKFPCHQGWDVFTADFAATGSHSAQRLSQFCGQ